MGDEASAGGAWERRRERVTDEIEAIALDLFVKRGFDAVTVDEIADAAGISQRTFFRYFPTKEDVLLRDQRRRIAQLQTALDAAAPDAEPVSVVRAALLAMASEYENDRARVVAWARVLAASPHLVPRFLGYQAAFAESVTEVIARRLGTDPARDLRARVAASAMLSASYAAYSLWIEGGAEGHLPTLVESSLDLLADGLGSLERTGARRAGRR